MSAREIIRASFGSAPDGLLGAIRRAGDEPLAPGTYKLMVCLLANPREAKRAGLLAHCGRITDSKVAVIARLPEPLLHINAFQMVRSKREAEDAAELVRLILRLRSDLDGAAIHKAVSDIGLETRLRRFVLGLLADFARTDWSPPHPGNDELVHLSTGAALLDAGRRLHNCLGGRADQVLRGMTAYYELTPARAIVALHRLEGGSWLPRLHAPYNGDVGNDVREDVAIRLGEFGIPLATPVRPVGFEALERVCGSSSDYDFADIDDGLG